VATTGLRHNAFVYESDDDYAGRSTAFLNAGLESGEAAVVAGTRDRLAIMREALGPSAEGVSFIDIGSAYTRPARTIASYYDVLLDVLRGAPAARLVAEVQYGPTPAEWDEWGAYEALFNVAYPHVPAWVICTYNGSTTPDPVVDRVWRSHPEVLTDDWQGSDHFEDPSAMVASLTPEARPLPELRSLPPGKDVEAVREELARALAAEDISPAKTLDMLLAAAEVADNAWKHGGGPRELRVGRADGRFVCEIVDEGDGFDDPLAGYIAPKDSDERPRGLWVARQLAWRVETLRSPDGFAVRLWL